MVCCGAGESDCKYSSDSESFQYVMHTSCLESLTEARKTPNKAIIESVVIVPECSTEEFVVQRSDALSMFDL